MDFSEPRRVEATRKRAKRDRTNHIAAIVGKKGMGKTTYARAIWRARIEAGGSGVWIDRTGQNGDLGTVVRSVSAFARALVSSYESRRPFRLVVNLGWGEDHGRLWRPIYEVGSCLLVLDDPRKFMSANRIDADLAELIELARNREVDITATVRRPPELHGSLKAAADAFISFRQRTRHYADNVAREYFHRPDLAEKLLHLPRFKYLRADDEGAITWGEVQPA